MFTYLDCVFDPFLLQVSLLTENGNTKDDLRLPTDENLLTQVSVPFTFAWISFELEIMDL